MTRGYLGTNVYQEYGASAQRSAVERVTGHRPRALRNNDYVGPAIAARHTDYDRAAWRTRNGSMSGAWLTAQHVADALAYDGRDVGDSRRGCVLPTPYADALRALFDDDAVERVYVVFSYATPIAWFVPGENLARVPNVRYSTTTSQHQSAVCGHRPLLDDGSRDYSAGYVHTGRHWSIDDIDPGSFRAGKGRSPFGPGGQAAAQYGAGR